MSPFKFRKTFLVATDFGPAAELALERAIDFARMMKAQIILLYVCPVAYLTPFAGTIVPDSQMLATGQTALANAVARHKESGVEIIARTEMGDPCPAIQRVATEVAADLIVMGTHGRRGVTRLFLGSTAEASIRASSIPVLTVREVREDSRLNT